MIDLKDYHKQVLSQFGQDGVIEKIYDLIGTTNKYFVEFGSHGNMEGQGNTPFLRQKFEMVGLLMDAESSHGEFEVRQHIVTSENINQLFEEYKVPNEFDFLSIDIDGCDWYVWKALDTKYQPRVVSIECNPHYEIGVDTVQPNTMTFGQNNPYGGCSLKAATNLANKKEYSLVAYCGVDAFFIRNDIIRDNNLEFVGVNDVDAIGKRLFNPIPPQFPSSIEIGF